MGRLLTLFALTWALTWAKAVAQSASVAGAPQSANAASTIYDPDPNHPWNRLRECLFVRRSPDGQAYGADSLDPLLWDKTKHLLTGESHRRALRCLDDFLNAHAENSIQDPVRRAVFQHDLWSVFDWAAMGQDRLPPNGKALLSRLARLMQRVALTAEQIGRLSDTYQEAVDSREFAADYNPAQPARPFLPALFRADGPWICLSGYSSGPTASMHFTGRSRFFVFMRLPGGRAQTVDYVHRLRALGESPLIKGDSPGEYLNLRLPQFPVGTQVALVRQMILIDSAGKLAPTSMTESVQIRVYHAITPGTRYINNINGPSCHDQDFFEFRLSRRALFARHDGGLSAVQPGEMEYPVLFTQGIDPFEFSKSALARPNSIILDFCRGCHNDSGIHSVQSRLHWMPQTEHDSGSQWDPSLIRAIEWETVQTIARKQRQSEFTVLRHYWGGDTH